MHKIRTAFRFLRSWFCFLVFGIGALALSAIFFPPAFFLVREPIARRRYFARVIRRSWQIMLWIFRAARLTQMRLHPAEAFEKLRGNVVVANHPSLIDILFLVAAIPESVCIVKNSLARNFVVSTLVRHAFLPNDIPPPTLLEKSKNLLAAGFNLIVFPEMTRTRLTATDSDVHRGAFHIALYAAASVAFVKIVPEQRILAKEQFPGYAGTRFVTYDLFLLDAPEIPAGTPRRQARFLAENFRSRCLSA